MKKILICAHAMELGGAERALLGLLEKMDYTRYAVDLFLMRHAGELLSDVPAQVRLLPEIPAYSCLAVPIGDVIRKRQFAVAFGRTRGKFLAKRRVRALGLPAENGVALEYSHRYTLPYMPPIQPETEYDLAVSFLTPHYFAAEKVRAKKKIAWIHTDYAKVKVDAESELKMWARYDAIASISEDVTRSFAGVFPTLESRVVPIPNIMPTDCIRRQADDFTVEAEMPDDGSVRLLSIGRYCTAKNFDNVPDICRRMIADGVNVKWYLIGFGGDEALIKRRIAESGMEAHVIMLGKKANPYPYIKACDLYVQPSRYEGNSVTVHEAQMLGKPVVITRYPTSGSQLEDGVDGVVVPMDNEGCAAEIADLLRSPERMEALCRNCLERDYSHAAEVEKLYGLMEDHDAENQHCCSGI